MGEIYLFAQTSQFSVHYIQTHHGKDGLWELAVLNFDLDSKGELDYNTDITGDVLGYLSWKNVENYLQEIMEL